MLNAINREKQLKNWHKDWKWNLIKQQNPGVKDLAADWSEEELRNGKGSIDQRDAETSSA